VALRKLRQRMMLALRLLRLRDGGRSARLRVNLTGAAVVVERFATGRVTNKGFSRSPRALRFLEMATGSFRFETFSHYP